MLARASAREREIGVRLALGASRLRLLSQMFVESLLLATTGAALGAGLAQLLSRFLLAFLSTEGSPLFMDFCDRTGACSDSGRPSRAHLCAFGLAPALRSTRVDPVSVLKAGGRV